MSLLYSYTIIPLKKKKIPFLPCLGCTVLLVPRRYSLPWYRSPDTDFQDRVNFQFYWCNRPWFWLPSENRISAKQSWCCNLGWWWHLWLTGEPSQGSAYISAFGHNYFHSDKITGGVEGEHGYSWGGFRSFPAIRCFIVCIMFCFLKIFKVSGVESLIVFQNGVQGQLRSYLSLSSQYF